MTLLSASEVSRLAPASDALSGVASADARTSADGAAPLTFPKVVCAWCHDVISDGGELVSHGLCLPCSVELFSDNQEV